MQLPKWLKGWIDLKTIQELTCHTLSCFCGLAFFHYLGLFVQRWVPERFAPQFELIEAIIFGGIFVILGVRILVFLAEKPYKAIRKLFGGPNSAIIFA
jgi:hypothetical protein